MIWNRLRITGALAVFLLVNSCGGKEKNPFERSLSIKAGDACFEVNQVVWISLSIHLTLTNEDFADLYKNALSLSLDRIAKVSPAIKARSEFQTGSNSILKGILGREVEDLSSCKAIQSMDRLVSKLETNRLEGQWTDTADGGWKRFIISRSPQQTYRIFLQAFAQSLDPFSRYNSNRNEAGWNFGVRTNITKLLAYGRNAAEATYLQVEAIDRFRSERFSSGIQVNDKVTALKLPADSLKFFGGSIAKNFTTDDWITIQEFFSESAKFELGNLFSNGPDEKIQAQILRNGKLIEIELTGIENSKFVDAQTVVTSEWLEGIGYIRLFEFDSQSSSKVARALAELKLQAERSQKNSHDFPLILDLRFNPGGQLYEALRIASLFVEQKKLGTREYRDPESKGALGSVSLYSRPVEEVFKGPIVILVNHLSASASEILSVFLRDAGRAIILGDDTFGKGIGQTTIDFGLFSELGGSFSFTTDIIYGTRGESPQWVSLKPDVPIHDLKILKMEAECKSEKKRECGFLSMQDLYSSRKDLKPILGSLIGAEPAESKVEIPSQAQLAEWRNFEKILADSEDRQLEAAKIIARSLER